MGIINTVRNMKQTNSNYIILLDIGKFYYSYGQDAYIMTYLFNYKLTKIEQYNIYSCAFPKQAMNKIISKLENKKINYIIVNRKNNYEIVEKSNNNNLNTYQKWLEKSKVYVKNKLKLDKIYNYLMENLETEDTSKVILEMEKIIPALGHS